MDWNKASARVYERINGAVTPILRAACFKTLARFPRAKYVAIRDAMGSAWIEIDGVHFHPDTDDRGRFMVVGYQGNRRTDSRDIRAPRLLELAEAMLECGDFLDEFHAAFPDITVTKEDLKLCSTKSQS